MDLTGMRAGMRAAALPLTDDGDLDPLLERIGDTRYVLIGEASHGTHEYYAWRAALTRRLVAEKDFSFVAVEGDWPDCYELHRCVTHAAGAEDEPRRVLDGFERWPTWMWANEDVLDFAGWLRDHNAGLTPADRVAFYGLDVYSLWDSMRALLDYLQEHEPASFDAALTAYRCFEPYGEDPQEYALATRFVPDSCEDAVVDLLGSLRAQEPVGGDDREARFVARQNAEVAAGAERYYRALVRGGAASWNVRDQHMTDTLDRLVAHHDDGAARPAKAVVWEHNTHVGDARATDMAAGGMVNVGQLVRERHADDGVVLVGLGGYHGSVIAGGSWGAQMERMPVPPARPHSVERALHDADIAAALFVFPGEQEQPEWQRDVLDHRAIGVVYHPERERWGNYVPTVLGQRYDAFCFFDQTSALRPLHLELGLPEGGEEEAYPTGL